MGTANTEKSELRAVVRERKPGNAPLEEGLIRIGLPRSWKGATSVYIEMKEGQKYPSIIFGRECLQIDGRFVRVLGSGDRKDKRGEKSAIVTVLEKETNHIEQEADILPCEEALLFIGGAKCGVALTAPPRETDPDADTAPRFRVPRNLSEEEGNLIKLETLQRGETLEIAKGHVLRFLGGGPRNRFLEIQRADGKCEKEFCAKDGNIFEMKLAGLEEVLVLRLIKETCAQNAVEVLVYPKKWENKE